MELAAEVDLGYKVFEEVINKGGWKGLDFNEETPLWLLICAVNSDNLTTLNILFNYYSQD